jgi:lipopolysaccharide export system ATP-binding protein
MSEAIEAPGTSAPAEHRSEELLPSVRIRPDSVLRAEHLVKRYGKRRVVDDVSLEVHPGEVVGLLGPNGAGKTTTFYMIVGLIKHSRGKIYLDGEEITHKAMYRRARMGIGYLSQEPSVFRKLTVEDNIRAILETTRLPRRQRKERLETLLDELGLRRVRKTKAYALSGGERRRLEITRALVTEPRYMLLDEPFAGVDPIAVDDLQSIVAALRDRGLGILITDHNVRETLQITDRAYLLYEGRILKSGAADELIADPEARRLYLGEDFRL